MPADPIPAPTAEDEAANTYDELLAVAGAAREYRAAEEAIGTVDARRLKPLADALHRRDVAKAVLDAALDAAREKEGHRG